MTIKSLVSAGADDDKHQDALDKTGHWGARGSGCLVMAEDTKRFLLCHRSGYVTQPHTWGVWGGAIDGAEDPMRSALRELKEETGYRGKVVNIVSLSTYKDKSFRYDTFLVTVPTEFRPVLDWESQGYKWVAFNKWPTPLHFGLFYTLQVAAPELVKVSRPK